tara:strand:+ start:683 stop:844 length:162 start_codon:yes stop_codon:yes gene_type:complete
MHKCLLIRNFRYKTDTKFFYFDVTVKLYKDDEAEFIVKICFGYETSVLEILNI